MSELRLGWCSHEAARKACEEWHYAGVLPTGKLVKIGVWEGGVFQGCVIYSRGASPFLGKKFDLDATEIAELTRVALRAHDAPVSKILSVSVRLVARASPGLRLLVSFADPARDHHGGIYQAANWIYTGKSNDVIEYLVRGRWRHTRGAYHEVKGRDDVPKRVMPGKHRYVWPLDAEMRELVELVRRPHPRQRVESSA